ncbi:MAG: hypothetical protein ACLP1X_10245 [Polyangiaceae bacterium]
MKTPARAVNHTGRLLLPVLPSMVSLSRALASSALLALATALAAGCDGVNVRGATDDVTPDAGVTVVTAYGDASDAGATGASAGEMSSVVAAPALSYQGSPLCNASRSTGCCYPDDPTNAQACAQAACQTGPDGGTLDAAPGAGAYVEVSLGCHVAPAEAAPDASAGSTAVSAVCLPGGQGLDGFPCRGPDDCAPAYECVGTTPTCQRYCCGGNDACVSLQFCDIQPTALSPATKVPVCMPMQPCTLLDTLSCPAGETCAVVRDDGSKSCVAIGAVGAGEDCETDHCESGLVCLGTPGTRSCYVLCHTSKTTECASSQKCQGGLPLFPDPDVGICQ